MVLCSDPGFLAAGMNSLNRYGLGKMVGFLKSEQKKKEDCFAGWEWSGWWGMRVEDREGRLRFRGFLYCLVDFQSPLVDPKRGDPRS